MRGQLRRLQDAFEQRRQALRGELAGVEPELALVIETAGSIQRFQRAVARIPGLEWLAEESEREMAPDEDFYREPSEKERERGVERKPFDGTLYLVMSDERARGQMLSLWGLYAEDEQAKFPRGLTPWREAFKHIRTIRPWGPEDRLRETGLLEDWESRLEEDSSPIRAQAELWFRKDAAARRRQVRELEVRLGALEGRLVGQGVAIPEIAYHGCIVEVPPAVAREVVEGREVELLRCEGIMLLRPVGQIAVGIPVGRSAGDLEEHPREPAARGEPIVAVLDGMPLEGHDLLRGRLRIDDPDGWGGDTNPGDRHHGTAMTSLVLHGDLSGEPVSGPLRRPVYARPLLRPRGEEWLGKRESVPEDVLEVDLVHRAVRRLLEGEEDGEPAAPEVLIVNLSFGDPSRPLDRRASPLARLLDWLSWKHGLLFVISAGNPPPAGRIQLDVPRQELRAMPDAQLRRHVWKAIVDQAHLRRLLAPAESVNAITVGGEHADGVGSFKLRGRRDLYGDGEAPSRLPSPVTALGPGVGRAIKPDLLYPAGRQLYRERYTAGDEPAELEVAPTPALPPGHRVASPGGEAGRRDQLRYLSGTSNAAALASRAAARLHERLPELLGDEAMAQLTARRELVPLLKALLVHGAHWGSGREALEEILAGSRADGIDRMTLGKYLGYGFPEEGRLEGCHEQRATFFGWGELHEEAGAVYSIPLPPSLSAKKVRRRLTITLAWLTPINPSDQRYRRAQLWFEPGDPEGDTDSIHLLRVKRTEADHKAVSRGTVQHEILEGEQASVFEDGDALTVKVSCRAHAGTLDKPVPYGLAISLEVAPGVELPIYEEMRVRLKPKTPVQP